MGISAILKYALIVVFGLIAAVIDVRTKRVPNLLIFAMLAAWPFIFASLLFTGVGAAVTLLVDSALGFVIGGGLFMLVYLISRSGLGGGDVKFMACAGLYLGAGGTIPAIFLGTVLAALIGLVLILLKKIGRKDKIPLIPFLFIGILVTVIAR